MPMETIRVLAIENNPGDAQLILKMLHGNGAPEDLPLFELASVDTLATALALLDKGGVDVVLAELDLPDSPAGDTLTQLCAHAPMTPIIVLTWHENEVLARQAIHAGAEDHLLKSELNGPRLARALLYAIERQRVRASLLKAYADLEHRVQQRTAELEQANEQLRQQIAERAQAEAALRESEERFRKVFEEGPLGMAILSPDDVFLHANAALCRMTGYTKEELVGSTYLDITHPGDVNAGKQQAQHLLSGDLPYLQTEKRYIAKDGQTLWINLTASLIRDDQGNPLYKLTMIEDVTEHKRNLEELERTQAQLLQAQKMEAIGRLAGGVAHDFNNLLTTVTGYTDLLLKDLATYDPIHADLEEIRRAASQGAALTRQLLAFSRRQVLQPKLLDLNTVVVDMEKMLRRWTREDIDLVTILEPEIGHVRVDPGQIEQVLMNLVINASDAMPTGGRLTIETTNIDLNEPYTREHIDTPPGHYVMLAVSDTGTGMDEEILSHLFEPFFTTKERGKGTGLGLSTVYGIVKQSGGSIYVYSEPGQGTTFKIYLPRIDEAAEIPQAPAAPPDLLRGSETILLVEDEAIVRALVKRVLLESGYTVLEAGTANEAVRLYKQAPLIHLLITDVVLPGGMSGPALGKHLQVSHPGLLVLYVSGYTDNAIVHHGVLDPRVNFLQKPFTPEALARKVRQVLDKAPLEKE